MALIRVFLMPVSLDTGRYLFSGGEPATFMQVDWFRDDPPPGTELPGVGTPEWRAMLTEFIRIKTYYRPDRAFLVLHPEHPFTINYEAP